MPHFVSVESASDTSELATRLRENTAAMETDGHRLIAISHTVEPGDGPQKYTAVLVYFK